MKKRLYIILVCLSVFGATLTGCGGSGENKQEVKESVGEEVRVDEAGDGRLTNIYYEVGEVTLPIAKKGVFYMDTIDYENIQTETVEAENLKDFLSKEEKEGRRLCYSL